MRMITVKLQGKEVQASLLSPEVTKKFEDGFYKTLERFQEATNLETGSDGIREQCQSVIDYVTDIFGEQGAKDVFGECTDLLTCVDVLEEMQSMYEDQVNCLISERVNRFKEKSKVQIAGDKRVE